MTRRAVNVVALAAAVENFFRSRERYVLARIVAGFPSVEISVFMQLAAGYSAFDRRTLGALVGEEIAAGKRVLARLDVHVEAARGGESQQRRQGNEGRASLDRTGEGARPHMGITASSIHGVREFAEARHLAGHLRNGARLQALEKASRAGRVVFGIGREHDQKETVFRCRRK